MDSSHKFGVQYFLRPVMVIFLVLISGLMFHLFHVSFDFIVECAIVKNGAMMRT